MLAAIRDLGSKARENEPGSLPVGEFPAWPPPAAAEPVVVAASAILERHRP
jgi:hypothetical protein